MDPVSLFFVIRFLLIGFQLLAQLRLNQPNSSVITGSFFMGPFFG